jgi:fido (protein-threonine AMPylation protein)
MSNFDRESLSNSQLNQIFALRQRGMAKAVQGIPFGPDWLSAAHHQLFKDVEPSAGKFRDERVAPFLKGMEQRLKDKDLLKGASQYEVVSELTDCFYDIVRTRPFKTDNKPIIRQFLLDLTAESGNAIAWNEMNPGDWNKAFKGVMAGDKRDARNMFHTIFREAGITVNNGIGIRVKPIKNELKEKDRAKSIAESLKKKHDDRLETTRKNHSRAGMQTFSQP